jgi:hypothetical protein
LPAAEKRPANPLSRGALSAETSRTICRFDLQRARSVGDGDSTDMEISMPRDDNNGFERQ